VKLRLVHPRQQGAVEITPAASIENAGYAAHSSSS
jgi:hypothetical protein